ncbi:MAG TPA: lysophospholipid acyltransferase family protein [Verrucomicrobiae bacterium]|nr:lysophospholipid acyltransferase family protein [Verrucomicrobiae bacterium]
MKSCPVHSSSPVLGRKRVSGVVVPNAPSRGQVALACVVANGMRLLAATLRYRVNGGRGPVSLPDEPVIFALWHNRLGLCMKVYKSFVRPDCDHEHLAALISASKDGALLAAVLRDFGVEAVRGSSSRRGAQALLELTSWAGRGYDLAVTPDGPKGPRHVVQDGVMALAQVTGLPIIPYSCRLGWKIQLKSWDRFQIPLPFSHCEMTFGEPIRVPRGATDAERGQLREQLQAVLQAGTQAQRMTA